jgi:hypothetical protein
MTVYNAIVAIGSVSSSLSDSRRIRRVTTTIAVLSSDTQNGLKEAKGQASVSIAPRSSFIIGSATGAAWQVTATSTYLPSPSQSLEYYVKPAQGLTATVQATASIQANTSGGVDTSANARLGVAIRSYSGIASEASLIKGEIVPGTSQYQSSTIYLGSGNRGDITTARITPQRWSDFSGLRAGFRIYSGDRDSMAVVLQDPQYRSDTIQIQIIEPFTELALYIGNWHIDIPEGTNFNDQPYTPNYFRSSDLLSSVMKDFNKFVVEPVQYQTERMRDFRRWDRVESGFFGPMARTVGMNIRLDRMDNEARRRAIHEWTSFTQYAGTRSFIDFEGYVIDTIFTIEHLWTNDYKNFIVKDSSIIYPNYYPTNHVALRYDANLWDINDVEDIRYIYETFYQLASVPLVLDYIYTLTQDSTQLWVKAVSHESEYAPPQANELPANFWIIAVDTDTRWAPIEENVLPPNFWMAAVETDVVMVSEYATFGTVIDPNYSSLP